MPGKRDAIQKNRNLSDLLQNKKRLSNLFIGFGIRTSGPSPRPRATSSRQFGEKCGESGLFHSKRRSNFGQSSTAAAISRKKWHVGAIGASRTFLQVKISFVRRNFLKDIVPLFKKIFLDETFRIFARFSSRANANEAKNALIDTKSPAIPTIPYQIKIWRTGITGSRTRWRIKFWIGRRRCQRWRSRTTRASRPFSSGIWVRGYFIWKIP